MNVAEEDVHRLKERQKMLDEILRKSEESRMALIKDMQESVERAISEDAQFETTME
jgi:hypothetical protein